MRHFILFCLASATAVSAQQPPYDVFPAAAPPYYRVRHEASTKPGELIFPASYTVWLPPSVKVLRGVIVHQHGCGQGSCKSGLTGAFDLHWQALARKHDCALLSPAYEQLDKADCQMWCDPRNGSSAAFIKALGHLAENSRHPELAIVPWALWGHSGGGHWAGGMVLMHPQRVAAAWLRSGVPMLTAGADRTTIKTHTVPDDALAVPLMCNLGTQEGVTVKEGRFAGVWPANENFFTAVRAKGGLVGVAVDPLTAHECGNQRYLSIPWIDACLTARLPSAAGAALRPMPAQDAHFATLSGTEAVPAAEFTGDRSKAIWLPNADIAAKWQHYVKDTAVPDTTPPPPPADINLKTQGNDKVVQIEITWDGRADLESGLARFIIEEDGKPIATVPADAEKAKNPFGRPIFQGLQFSDTPNQPLVQMKFAGTTTGGPHRYTVRAVNTVGLKSKESPASRGSDAAEARPGPPAAR